MQRATLYRHFPDEDALFEACSAHWNARNAPPDPTPWTAIEDPDERLRAGLTEIYGWYEQVEPMLEKLYRDISVVPALAHQMEQGAIPYLNHVSRAARRWPAAAQARRARRSAMPSPSTPGVVGARAGGCRTSRRSI